MSLLLEGKKEVEGTLCRCSSWAGGQVWGGGGGGGGGGGREAVYRARDVHNLVTMVTH